MWGKRGKVRFAVTIEDRTWDKFVARMERLAEGSNPVDIIEGAIAAALLTNHEIPGRDDTSSTSIMLMMNRVKVDIAGGVGNGPAEPSCPDRV